MKISKRKAINWSAILVALSLTVFYLFGFVHNVSNNRYWATEFKEHVRPGYETSPATVKVDISPKLAMSHTPALPIIFGFAFMVLTVVAIWYVATKKSPDEKPYKDILTVLIPTILTGVFLFGWYSPKVANNWVEIRKERFDNLVNTGAIEKRGEHTYADPVDSLKNLFKDKQIVR